MRDVRRADWNLKSLLERGVGMDCAMQSLPESTIPGTMDAAAATSAIERILQKDLQTKGLQNEGGPQSLSLIHISVPTRLRRIPYAVSCAHK